MAGPVRYNRNHRDANEGPLIQIAERLGASWLEGPPLDGWILFRGCWFPVEIKQPDRAGRASEFEDSQKGFFAWAAARGGRWLIWRDTDDVLRDLGAA